MALTEEQLCALVQKIDEFQESRDPDLVKLDKLTLTDRNNLADEIRLKARINRLGFLIDRTLLRFNQYRPDPLLTLDDATLIALDDTIERAIFAEKNGKMFEDARVVPPHELFAFDMNDPIEQELMRSIRAKMSP